MNYSRPLFYSSTLCTCPFLFFLFFAFYTRIPLFAFSRTSLFSSIFFCLYRVLLFFSIPISSPLSFELLHTNHIYDFLPCASPYRSYILFLTSFIPSSPNPTSTRKHNLNPRSCPGFCVRINYRRCILSHMASPLSQVHVLGSPPRSTYIIKETAYLMY